MRVRHAMRSLVIEWRVTCVTAQSVEWHMTWPYRAQWRQQSPQSCSADTMECRIQLTVTLEFGLIGASSRFGRIYLLFVYLFVTAIRCQRSRCRKWAIGWTVRVYISDNGNAVSLFAKLSKPALGPTQPPIKWVAGAHSPKVKRPGREAVCISCRG
jgi:hypothetical protein